jgi:hypothetical protein
VTVLLIYYQRGASRLIYGNFLLAAWKDQDAPRSFNSFSFRPQNKSIPPRHRNNKLATAEKNTLCKLRTLIKPPTRASISTHIKVEYKEPPGAKSRPF